MKTNLSKTSDMTSAERNDVLYYLLYAVSAKILGKKNISFLDVKNMNIDNVTDVLINELKTIIYKKYKELGGNGRVAKSDTFINEIDKILGL